MKTSRYYIYGLDCPNCALKVEKGLADDPRINTASVDYAGKRIEISSKEALTKEDIQAIVDKYEDGCSIEDVKKEDEEGRRFKIDLISTGIRAALSLILAIIGLVWITEDAYGLYANLAIMLVAYLISAYDIYYKAIIDIFKHHNFFDENVLMCIATIGAFLLRLFGPDSNEFFEAVMVVVLYQIGELFETFASGKSHKAIIEAVGLKAREARRVTANGELEIVPPEAIREDDLIEIRVGDLIPVDGIVVEGTGTLDQSSLTGEFMPVEATADSNVRAGTLLKSGSIKIKATATYADSSVAKILEMVESGNARKSKVDKFISKFSRIYTPVVIVLAICIAVIPSLITGNWERWIYTALSALVISCPCAIVISVPLSYFAGLGLSSKNGIVIKGSDNFDTLNALTTLCVDKTGTLTEGRLKLDSVNAFIPEDEFMEYLKASECRSSHPIAVGILNGEDPSTYSKNVTKFDEIAGHGTKAVYKKKTLLAGNAKFMADNGVEVEAAPTESGTIVHLAVNGKWAGYVSLDDAIRPEAKALVERVHAMGKKIVLLTGDHEAAAKKVSEALGLDAYYAGLLPEDKRSILEKLDEEGETIAYLGDGINDAPCIVAADIGFAMGGIGSDLAIENADAIIMNDDPSKVATAIEAANKTRKRAIINIVASLVIKVAVLVLNLCIANFPLYIAVLADTGLTAVLILNALALLKTKLNKAQN